ncbi:MAG: molybdopterin-dependent oxidoreductase [Halioglobus sp.]|nr:molybdopterin-dependent oxidoreductase [Halioglobus sp.]
MGKWTRRAFITTGVLGGGALLVGVGLRLGNRNSELAPLVATEGEHLVNAWVKIGADNQVVAIVPHSEMGQGAQTALAQMLADELDARWEDVSFLEAPAEDAYANWSLAKGYALAGIKVPAVLEDSVNGLMFQASKAMKMQITGGSLSVRATGVYGMRVAGAAARELLIEAAAATWQVSPAKLTARDSHIIEIDGERSAPFAAFAAAAGRLSPNPSPRLKHPDEFRIMGRSTPRLDIPAKVNGTAQFGIDATAEGMQYATIQAPPVFGASMVSFDASRAKAMRGVVDVVQIDDAVAVVADSYWNASRAMREVDITWSHTDHDSSSSQGYFNQFAADMQRDREQGSSTVDIEKGDAVNVIANAEKVISRSYQVPWLAHTCMEPMNALAQFSGDSCEVWTGTQNPLGTKHAIAAALEVDVTQVTLHQHQMGGGFGRRAKPDTAIQAAKLARAVGKPVKLIWSREEDVQHDHYRPAVRSEFRAVLDEAGKPLAWENQFVDKHEPAEAPYVPYAVPNQYVHYTDSPTHVPFGAWRSVDHSQHGFFTESFIDELAYEAGADPYAYRRELLAQLPRHRAVLDKAAAAGNWDTPLGEGRGRGISFQESFGTLVAQIVEVTLADGDLSVDRVVVVVDPGFAVSPDGLTAQMESGVVYGLTAALYGEISIENGAVAQSNFHDYNALRMDRSPVIETHIINSMEHWGGAGEPGTPGIAPALANAIYAARGVRIRELPITKYELGSASV